MVVRISDKTQNYSKVTKLLVKPIINYSTKETAEASLDHIIKTYSECLENGIKEKLKGKTPEGLHSNAAINDMQDKQNKIRKYMGIK